MKSATDYKVRPRTEAEIKSLADRCRQLGGVDQLLYFNIITYLRRCFRSPTNPRNELLFAVVPEWHPRETPYVKYNPLTLVATQRLLNRADIGDPFPRFQLAHETGHIVMHDHHAKAFSSDQKCRISFENKIFSAEWQANTFAKYFLLPDWIFYAARSESELIEQVRIPPPLLEERLEDVVCLNKSRGVEFSWGKFTGQLSL